MTSPIAKFAIAYAALLLVLVLSVCGHLRAPSPPCSDYEMLMVNTRDCVARCPIRCRQGVCYETGPCPCAGGYETSFQNDLICARQCLTGCIEAGGYCAAADLCLCRRKGDVFDAVSRRCRPVTRFHDRCLGRCLYGRCSSTGECICAQGFKNQTAPTLLGQFCVPTCRQECGPRAFCYLPDICACRKKHHHYESDGKCRDDISYFGR